LLSKWKGEGADAYRQETDNILANIGGIRDVLDAINNGAVKAIKESYLKLDEELGNLTETPMWTGKMVNVILSKGGKGYLYA